MKLDEYLAYKKIPLSALASLADIPPNILYNMRRGKEPSLKYAIKLHNLTKKLDGTNNIDYVDMLSTKNTIDPRNTINPPKKLGRPKKSPQINYPDQNCIKINLTSLPYDEQPIPTPSD